MNVARFIGTDCSAKASPAKVPTKQLLVNDKSPWEVFRVIHLTAWFAYWGKGHQCIKKMLIYNFSSSKNLYRTPRGNSQSVHFDIEFYYSFGIFMVLRIFLCCVRIKRIDIILAFIQPDVNSSKQASTLSVWLWPTKNTNTHRLSLLKAAHTDFSLSL